MAERERQGTFKVKYIDQTSSGPRIEYKDSMGSSCAFVVRTSSTGELLLESGKARSGSETYFTREVAREIGEIMMTFAETGALPSNPDAPQMPS